MKTTTEQVSEIQNTIRKDRFAKDMKEKRGI